MQKQRNVTLRWAREAPLHEVCIEVADRYRENKKSLNGAVLAAIASRLVAAELHPGGPYKHSDGSVDIVTNLSIGYLFACLQKPLPYIESLRKKLEKHSQHPPSLQRLLLKYRGLSNDTSPLPPPSNASYTAAYSQLGQLPKPLKTLAFSFLDRLEKTDKNREIALLPTFFYESLTTTEISPSLSILGEANIYCWIAYTIYDHLLDGEQATQYLPVANVSMRLALQRYQSLFPGNPSFQQKVMSVFDGMDAANSWEMKYCRFEQKGSMTTITTLPAYGRYDFLARRSLGHALGPLAIAYANSLRPLQVDALEKGFRHYLIARQLSDDIHDWQEDMRAGHGSAVVTYILNDERIKAGTYEIEPLISTMQSNFWRRSMQATNTIIRQHVRLSRKYLSNSQILRKDGPFLELVTRLDAIATESSLERQRYEEFSSTYRQLSPNTR